MACAGQAVRAASKQAKTNKEPWLLAVSPQLAGRDADAIVAIYGGRMQIEQTFRDIKNPRWGLGLSDSQTRQPARLANLLLMSALACYALGSLHWRYTPAATGLNLAARKRQRMRCRSFLWPDGGLFASCCASVLLDCGAPFFPLRQ